MPDPSDLRTLHLVLRVLDAASATAERSLLNTYPMLDEDPLFDPHRLDDDPHDAAAEIAFVLRSLRLALRRYRRLMQRRRGPLRITMRAVLQDAARADTRELRRERDRSAGRARAPSLAAPHSRRRRAGCRQLELVLG